MTTPNGISAAQAYREGQEAPAGTENPYAGNQFLAAVWLQGHQSTTDKTISADGGD